MADESARAALGSVGLFQGLSDRELEQVLGVAREVRFEPGRNIVSEGEQGVGFHLIREGTARVSGGGQEFGALGPGDYFGEISLIDEGPRSATVTADSEVTTLSLVSWDFLPLLDRNPGITRKLLVQLCRRLRASEASPTQ